MSNFQRFKHSDHSKLYHQQLVQFFVNLQTIVVAMEEFHLDFGRNGRVVLCINYGVADDLCAFSLLSDGLKLSIAKHIHGSCYLE